MHCEVGEHQPNLEESKQNMFKQKFLLLLKKSYVSIPDHIIHYQPNPSDLPYLLRNFKANVRTKSEHVLHLVNCCRDEWYV